MQALFMNSYQLTWAQVLGALLLCCLYDSHFGISGFAVRLKPAALQFQGCACQASF